LCAESLKYLQPGRVVSKMYLTFIISEFKKWLREPLTRIIIFYPLLFGAIGRYLLPYVEENTAFLIAPYADIITASLVLMMPMIFGALIAFSILDDRDDDVLDAVAVTPLGLTKFFSFRLIMIYFCSFLACLFVILFADIVQLKLTAIVHLSALASLSAPMTGLFINAFAKNKIEGFAVMKGFGALIFFPIIALFFTDFKELFFALAPGFFPAKMLSTLIRSEKTMFLSYSTYVLAGWSYGFILNILSYKIFQKRK